MIKPYKKVPSKRTIESLSTFKSDCNMLHAKNMALIENAIQKLKIDARPATKEKKTSKK
jgi:hypothetical protein